MSRRRKLTAAERKEVWNRTNRRCGYCGQRVKLEDMQVDHMQPLSRGGSNRLDNMICSCAYCNEYKAARIVNQFRRAVRHSVAVLESESLAYSNAERFGLIRKTNNEVVFYYERLKRRRSERWIKKARLRSSRSKRS